jgi:hypothetical protein
LVAVTIEPSSLIYSADDIRTLPMRDNTRRSNFEEQLTIPAMEAYVMLTLQSLPLLRAVYLGPIQGQCQFVILQPQVLSHTNRHNVSFLSLLSRGSDLLPLLEATSNERNAHRSEACGQSHHAWKASSHPISTVAETRQRVRSGRRGSGNRGRRSSSTRGRCQFRRAGVSRSVGASLRRVDGLSCLIHHVRVRGSQRPRRIVRLPRAESKG